MARPLIRRRFVHVGDRVVHYRRSGKGPPVVLIHQSPQSSAGLIPLISALSTTCTVFAFDTPGCGDSDALPRRKPGIRHYADALAATMDALDIPKAAVFGTKTGSCIALELANRYPQRVSGVVLDSLPIFTRAEVADMTRIVRTDEGDEAYYLMPFAAKWDGSHLISTWSHVRDHVFWFPWYNRKAAARRDINMPPPTAMHAGIIDNFRAGDDLRVVVEAAFRYRARAAVETLTVPATFSAREDSMLFHCLDMLPPLRRRQRIVRLDRDMKRYWKALSSALHGYAKGRPPADCLPTPIPGRTTRFFADRSGGRQILVRRRGAEGDTPLVMLHDGPGSSRNLAPLVAAFAPGRIVLAPDLPGNGDSTPLPMAAPEINDYAAEMARFLRARGPARIDLYGRGSGAAVALSMTAHYPKLVRRLVLHDVMLLPAAERRAIATDMTPSIAPTWDGAHLYRTWLMLRDASIYWPWYRRDRQAIRRIDFDLSAAELQDRVLDVLKAWPTYGLTTQAMLRYQPQTDLAKIRTPVLVVSQTGDVFAATAAQVARLCHGESANCAPDLSALAAQLTQFLTRPALPPSRRA
ncbi:MAG: alpha/beta fold hydrolase [Alphaproteobacteria bacterium]